MKSVIVGCGQIADAHVSELQKIEGVDVVGVCDIHEIMATQIATRFGVNGVYTDFTKLLSECKPDVVHITTPPATHLPLGKQAMSAGCHVYIEKPFGVNSNQAKELIDTARRKALKITIGYNHYYDQPARKVRRLINEGVLGDIVHIESFLGYDLSGPFGSIMMSNPNHWVHNLPGKIFQNNLNHAVHIITEFMHDENPEVIAIAKRLDQYQHFGDIRDEMMDELRVIIGGENMTAYITFSSHIRPMGYFARVYGTKNSLTLDWISKTVVVDSYPRIPTVLGKLFPPFTYGMRYIREGLNNLRRFIYSDFHYFAGLNLLIKKFYESIKKETEPPIPYDKIILDTIIMQKIFEDINKREDNKK